MDWQSGIFEIACVQCEQWHSPCTCCFYNSSDVRFYKVGFGCLCFLQDMAIKHQENSDLNGTQQRIGHCPLSKI